MNMVFDSKIPRIEQLLRSWGRKIVGRKHNHTKGPGRKANDERVHRKNVVELQLGKRRKHSEAVSAYWRGERATHPDGRR